MILDADLKIRGNDWHTRHQYFLTLKDEYLYGVQRRKGNVGNWNYASIAVTENDARRFASDCNKDDENEYRVVKISKYLPQGLNYPPPQEVLKLMVKRR